MLIPRFKEEKEPKLDYRAGRQIFDKEYDRSDGFRLINIPKDTTNPIDIALRRLSISSLDGRIDVKNEFFNKWVAIMFNPPNTSINNLRIITGRIKDVYLHTRDVYVKTRKGDVYIVPFDRVMELSEKEL